MSKEIESKFVKISPNKIKKKLALIGAKKVFSKKLFKRYVFGETNGECVRVRTDGNKTFITYKNYNVDKKVGGMEEVEVEVSNFEDTVKLFKKVYNSSPLYQENYREEWKIGDVKFDIDFWPLIDPVLEIEAKSQKEILKYSNMLELDYSKAELGGYKNIYEKYYNISLHKIRILKF